MQENDIPAAPFGDYSESTDLDVDTVSRFREVIYEYYGEHGRAFPWRSTDNPYEILVSEIMLQQTQTQRVLPKYLEFLTIWPDLTSLSQATLADVYGVWAGLGYNRRAKALVDIAKEVTAHHGGTIPEDETSLRMLPMVGQATAAAIRGFAFGIPTVYLETNVRRVFLFFFFVGRSKVHDREIVPLAEAVLDRDVPRQWNYALMDYGEYLKRILPNTNRKSAHYSRQSTFENSNRQIRGSILKHLLEFGPESKHAIQRVLRYEIGRTENSLKQLEAEGMVVCENGKYKIPG